MKTQVCLSDKCIQRVIRKREIRSLNREDAADYNEFSDKKGRKT